MATQVQAITSTPAKLAPTTALVDGVSYVVQNTGPNEARFAETVAAPASSLPAHVLREGASGVYTPDGTNFLWIWCHGKGGTQVAVTEE